VEVSDFVPKLGTLVLSVFYSQFYSLSLKFTYLLAFICHPNSDNQRYSTNQRLRKTLVSYTTNVISPLLLRTTQTLKPHRSMFISRQSLCHPVIGDYYIYFTVVP
jgi:hypothetical protein